MSYTETSARRIGRRSWSHAVPCAVMHPHDAPFGRRPATGRVASRWMMSTSSSRSATLIRSCRTSTVSSSRDRHRHLVQDHPGVDAGVDQEHRRAGDLDPVRQRVPRSVHAGEGRQQRRVGVDHPAAERGEEGRPDQLHEAGADHQVRRVRRDLARSAPRPSRSGSGGRPRAGRRSGRRPPRPGPDPATPGRSEPTATTAAPYVRVVARRRAAPAAGCRCRRSAPPGRGRTSTWRRRRRRGRASGTRTPGRAFDLRPGARSRRRRTAATSGGRSTVRRIRRSDPSTSRASPPGPWW